jgi:hypothetical protein
MTDYKPVQDALAAGADPAMLCATCPWDRYCLSPPTMTRAEIDKQIKDATEQDERDRRKAVAEGRQPGMPVGAIMTAVVVGGRDTMAQICPVLALRLRSGTGRQIADRLKASMQKWDDQS